MNESVFNGSDKADMNLSVKERIAIRQALEMEINRLKKIEYTKNDRKRINQIKNGEKALSKINLSLTRKDYEGEL